MAKTSMKLALKLTPSPKQNALAEAITSAMMANVQAQIALQDFDLNCSVNITVRGDPRGGVYHAAAGGFDRNLATKGAHLRC
jgi:hypothetical protein